MKGSYLYVLPITVVLAELTVARTREEQQVLFNWKAMLPFHVLIEGVNCFQKDKSSPHSDTHRTTLEEIQHEIDSRNGLNSCFTSKKIISIECDKAPSLTMGNCNDF